VRGRRRANSEWFDGHCPGHPDERASLSFCDGEHGVIVKCQANQGCTIEKIAAALERPVSAFFFENGNGATPKAMKIIASYDYVDERGALLYQVVRLQPKDFRQRRPDGRGGWTWSVAGVRRVVYRLDELAEAERVIHVEGEECADRVVALDWRATTTPGGADQWRDDYADQVKAAGVTEVVILPDNDAAGQRYAADAARSYLRRMIRVKVVHLPDLPDKGDIVNFLDAGHTREDLAALIDATAWLTEAPELEAEPTTGPVVSLHGEDGTFTWADERVEIHLTGARESGEGVHAECRVTRADSLVHWGRLNLSSTSMREGLVKKLSVVAAEVLWREHLELACYRMAEHVRTGTPLVELCPAPRPVGQRDLIERVMPQDETSLIYADGDSGKGMLALTIALAVMTGQKFPHLIPTRKDVRVAYLDWETTEAEIAARVDGLCRGLGITLPPGLLLYRAMSRALADEASRLRADLARRHVGLVIVDSMVPACGADPEGADATMRTLNALRSFTGTTRLVIAHVNRVDADKTRGTTRPWGSVFVRNLVRAAWEVKRGELDGDDLVLAAYLNKRNDGKRGVPPWGLRFSFAGDGAVTVKDAALAHSPELLAKATIWQQIRAALSNGAKTAEAIACELHLGEPSVRKTLERHRADGHVVNVGTATPRPWALAADRKP
jgi:hypothetical protein